MMQFSKTTMPPFTELELFSHSLKCMKVNFNIFPGQHNQQISTNITEPLSSVLETRVRNRFPPPTSLKQHEDDVQEGWYKILLETV
jgi:transposase-like protein